MSDIKVEYRDVVGFPNYRVGNDGSVWSCQKYHNSSNWRKLKPSPIRFGYLMAGLYRDKKLFKIPVHRLVLEMFISPCPPNMQCCHFPDPSPSNNNLTNLRWGTVFDNARDKKIHGTSGGWKFGEDICKKLSAQRKGRKKSPEHVAKVIAAITGYKHTKKARSNMRKARLKWLAKNGR